jgi:large subunit ribosomal protein L5e
MGFVKVVKNKAYFKRFQVKFRRRRECKTDYYARKRLIIQDKNKYKTPKYRFVVRFSNKDITCQIIAADLDHDVTLAAAYAHELPRYGVKHGLTNYAAAYCTGLLLARRVIAKYKLDYEGNTDIKGEDYNVEANPEGAAPFRAVLDVGLARTTTGARIFGALKGATDGGLEIPHNDRRFPGTKKEGKDVTPNAELHRKYIFGGHVADYMRSLADNEESLKRQFGKYTEDGVGADDIEGLYTAAHTAIRKDPTQKRGASERGNLATRSSPKDANAVYPKKKFGRSRISVQQRKGRIRAKLRARGVGVKGGAAAAAAPAAASTSA